MDKKTKLLAYRAINENTTDTTARQIIRYVMECEMWGQDTTSPSNQYLAKKFKWTLGTTRVAVTKAKKSGFIGSVGRGKTRTLELNVNFLKGKMAEIAQRQPLKSHIWEELASVVPNEIPNRLPNDLPNTLPNKLPNKSPNNQNAKNLYTATQNGENGVDNNNSININSSNNISTPSVQGSKPTTKYNPRGAEVIKALEEVDPLNKLFYGNTTQRKACDFLIENYGLEEVLNRIDYYLEAKQNLVPYLPTISTPVQLRNKWKKLEMLVHREIAKENKKKQEIANNYIS